MREERVSEGMRGNGGGGAERKGEWGREGEGEEED